MEPTYKKIKLNSKTASKSALQDLPEEVIDEILEYCKINDILKLSEVNKFWNFYIKSSQKWMKKIALTVTEKNYKEISKCTRLYQKVRVKPKTHFQSEALKKALHHQLESIRDIELSINNLAGIKVPNLRKMYLRNYDQRDFNNDVKQAFLYYAKLTKLEIIHICTSNNHVDMAVEMLKNLKALKTVHIQKECKTVSKSIIALDLSYGKFDSYLTFPNLQYLHVKHLYWDDIKDFFQHLPHMKRVEFQCLHVGYSDFDNVDHFKHALICKKIDFDKENKTNIKFVKSNICIFAQEVKFFSNM
jgi:hypothetical protein